MSKHNMLKGQWGEGIAQNYLVQKGYQVLAVNYRHKFGEIDLVCSIQETVVFVEVKTRFSKEFGVPEEAVNYRKQCQLRKLAQIFMLDKKMENKTIRFDVIAISRDKHHKVTLNHIVGAF